MDLSPTKGHRPLRSETTMADHLVDCSAADELILADLAAGWTHAHHLRPSASPQRAGCPHGVRNSWGQSCLTGLADDEWLEGRRGVPSWTRSSS